MCYIAAYVLGLATYPLVYGLYWLWIYLFVKDVTIRCVR